MACRWPMTWLRMVTVEPIRMLTMFAIIFRGLTVSTARYNKVCQLNYGLESVVNCGHRENWPLSAELLVQRQAANWDLYTLVAYLIPAIFFTTVIGAWGDRVGRQGPILVGLAGFVCALVGPQLVFSAATDLPLLGLVVASALSSVSGYAAITPMSTYAYLADVTPSKRLLTIRLAVFGACVQLAAVAAPVVAGRLLAARLSPALVLLVGQALLVAAFLYSLVRIPQIPPRLLHPHGADSQRPQQSLVVQVARLFWDAVKTYAEPREGHRRLFIQLMLVVNFLITTVLVETQGNIMYEYTFRRHNGGLGWTSSELGNWLSADALFGLLVGTTAAVALKLLHFRDTTLMIVGLLSSAAKLVGIGVASHALHMYVASALGSLAGLTIPALTSFVTQLVRPDELGKVFTLYGISIDVSIIMSSVVYTAIYKATLPFFPGFLFLSIAGLLVGCVLMLVWVHFKAKSENIGVQMRAP